MLLKIYLYFTWLTLGLAPQNALLLSVTDNFAYLIIVLEEKYYNIARCLGLLKVMKRTFHMQFLGCRTGKLTVLFARPELFAFHTQYCCCQPTTFNSDSSHGLKDTEGESGQPVLSFC